MADERPGLDPRDGAGPGDTSSPDEAGLASRLGRLDERLKAHDEANRPRSQDRSSASGIAQAIKISSEFVAGVVVGAALGWGFDRLLGTSPWGLIVFLMLGFAAGVLNVLRGQGVVPPPADRLRPGPDDGANGQPPRRDSDET